MNRRMRRQAGAAGGLGGFGPDLLRQAQEIQNQMLKAQAELEASTVTATAGGGAVAVELYGNHKLKAITIAPEVVDPADVEMLQDLIIAAVNEGIDKLEAKRSEIMGPLAGGLKLPGT
jgi:DNA-binding YbaB/EbfC family protein